MKIRKMMDIVYQSVDSFYLSHLVLSFLTVEKKISPLSYALLFFPCLLYPLLYREDHIWMKKIKTQRPCPEYKAKLPEEKREINEGCGTM